MEDSDRAVLVSTNGETPTVKRTNSQRRSLARRKILLLNNLDSDIIATGDPIKTACHGSADHDDGLDMSGTSECGQNSDSTGNRESGFSTLSSDSTVSTVTSDETLATENQSMSSWSSADTEKSETMPTAAAAAAGDDDTVWVSSPGDSGIHVTRISVTSDDINDSGTDRDTDIADRVIARLAQDSNLVKRLYSVCDLWLGVLVAMVTSASQFPWKEKKKNTVSGIVYHLQSLQSSCLAKVLPGRWIEQYYNTSQIHPLFTWKNKICYQRNNATKETMYNSGINNVQLYSGTVLVV